MTTIVNNDLAKVVNALTPQLWRPDGDKRPVVLMTCGIAGAGKTTLAKAVLKEFQTFERLSIDEIIAWRHGIFGIDYTPEKYERHQNEADELFMDILRERLADGSIDIVLDRSFFAKEDRDEFKRVIEKAGARWVLVYFEVDERLLWSRICGRRASEVDANSALLISEDLFKSYLEGFEHPHDEGEIIVKYTE